MAPSRISANKRGKGPAKRFPITLRTTFEERTRIERGADKHGRSLIQEVEHRLGLAAWIMERMPLENIELRDLDRFARWAQLIAEAVEDAGDERINWFTYTTAAAFDANLRLDDPIARETITAAVRAKVQWFVDQDEKLPPVPDRDWSELSEKERDRTFVANKAEEIRANRAKRSKGNAS